MSVTAAQGFVAGGIACGIKDGDVPDLAVVAAADGAPVPAAGVFTTNRVQAAPVQVSRQHLEDGQAAAVVLNSGNANAATGERGMSDALRMAQVTGDGVGCPTSDVLVCSTGLIGIPMPIETVEAGIPKLTGELAGDEKAGTEAAEAILTTDTRAKQAAVALGDGTTIMVGGMAKGAAMLAPAMATMLAVVTTDATADAAVLKAVLNEAVDQTFHQLTVDGCTSTNDTVLMLANGAAGSTVEPGSPMFHALTRATTEVLADLAEQMARDAEGATKLARIHVGGARSKEEARRAARQVADSLLVKCSLYGQDPYWGRVLSELGASGVTLEPDRVSIAYNGHTVCRGGVAADHDEAAVTEAMQEREIEISCDLGLGAGSATVLTSDLTHAYVDENMGTS